MINEVIGHNLSEDLQPDNKKYPVTQGGEDPDPDVREKRNKVQEVDATFLP